MQMTGSTISSQVIEQMKPLGTSPPGDVAELAPELAPCARISPPQPAAERLTAGMRLACARISSTCACRSSQLAERVNCVLSIGEDGSETGGGCIGGWRGPVGFGLGLELGFDPPPAPPDPAPASAARALVRTVARLRMALITVDERRVLAGVGDVEGAFEVDRATLLPESFLFSLWFVRLRLLAEVTTWILALGRLVTSAGRPKS
eukprot:CAMPEP_0119545054 /NCGR_PEP_ID=MMETSP1344-20130328/55046_1 /TAXON_ID=236787 /ORGANISM="Florenciella parvula, Strain CCMP2471" /LENGTH=205 /DNA_ID=CAMNT_0007589567 /DNA_START=213 /DNA_END=830 /DNA_ORIENTATION=+